MKAKKDVLRIGISISRPLYVVAKELAAKLNRPSVSNLMTALVADAAKVHGIEAPSLPPVPPHMFETPVHHAD